MIKLYTVASDAMLEAKNSVSAPRRKLVAEESGATAIEYARISAGIAVAIIGIVFTLGKDIAKFFQAVDTRLTARTPT